MWTEAFAVKGDINYARLFDFLVGKGVIPHLVLAQAVENDTSHSLTVVEAHRLSRRNVKKAVA